MAAGSKLCASNNISGYIFNSHEDTSINDAPPLNVKNIAVGDMKARIVKGILAFAFLLLTYNLSQIATSESIGYAVDIYSVMPETLIPSLFLCFSIATSLMLGRSMGPRYACVLLLFLTLFTILIIPYSLGYYSMGRADDMSYIGEYVHISRAGHISNWNIYPASLIIGATLSVIIGVEAHIVSFIVPIVFSSLFVVGIYIFGRMFLTNRLYSNILFVSSFILYLGSYNFLNVPHALFFAFMPIFLFVIFRYVESKSFSYSIMIVLLSLLLSFTHPFVVFFILVLLSSLLIIKPISKKIINGDIGRLKTPLLIQFTCLLAWLIYSSTLLGSLKRSIRAFLLGITEPILSETAGKFATASLDPYSLLNFFIIYYGRYIIPTIVIIVFFVTYYRRVEVKTDTKRSVQLLLILYSISLIAEMVIFINPIISHQPDRISNLLFPVYFQVPLFALSLLFFLKKTSTRHNNVDLRKVAVIGIIVCTFGLSLYGAFDSPKIDRPNVALTYNEVAGMNWLYEFRDGENISAPISQIVRFHALFDDGISGNSKDNDINIPDHFGYNDTSIIFTDIVKGYDGPLYVVILSTDVTLYEEIPAYKNVGRYSYGDFHQFLYDKSVNRIYSGLNIDISHSYG